MKSVYLRSGLALLCAAALNGCGGGNGNLVLSVTISGLNKPDLVLTNTKTKEVLPVPANTSYISFTKLAAVDEEFNIVVSNPPTGATCNPVGTSNVGKANSYTAYQISFTCAANPRKLGGTVTGLDTKGLVLANGADTLSVEPPAVAGAPVNFVFNSQIGDGSPYGVTILAQPKAAANGSSKVCTVANNTGTVGATDYLGVAVTCK